jgi:hypothetical protein
MSLKLRDEGFPDASVEEVVVAMLPASLPATTQRAVDASKSITEDGRISTISVARIIIGSSSKHEAALRFS